MEVDMECNFCPGFEIYRNFQYCSLGCTLSECGLLLPTRDRLKDDIMLNQRPVVDLFILCDKNERCCKEGQSRRIHGGKVRLRDCQCALSLIFWDFQVL